MDHGPRLTLCVIPYEPTSAGHPTFCRSYWHGPCVCVHAHVRVLVLVVMRLSLYLDMLSVEYVCFGSALWGAGTWRVQYSSSVRLRFEGSHLILGCRVAVEARG